MVRRGESRQPERDEPMTGKELIEQAAIRIGHIGEKVIDEAKRHPWTLLAAGVGGALVGWLGRTKAYPALTAYITSSQRDSYFGPLRAIPAPTASNPEGILITNDFEKQNIVTRVFPIIGKARVHKLMSDPLYRVMTELEKKGYTNREIRFFGAYYPRFVRGSSTSFSAHAYGTAVDINADDNPQGSANVSPVNRAIAPIFEKHGFYHGVKFSYPDPHHFEFIVPPKGIA